MKYTQKIKDAIVFAIKTHELDQKQKRKGKDIPYITHPLTVGLILASAGANEDLVSAGILHDTVEDSIETNKVTKEILAEKFGQNVADLVLSVTEQGISLTWEERKKEALEHIKNFSNDSVMLKSGDIISNVSEIKDDFDKDGNKMFDRFFASKERTLEVYKNVAKELLIKWPESPLADDLQKILEKIELMK
ncbi:MAG: HD domain-containing protein [Minisyncoccia bacterium]